MPVSLLDLFVCKGSSVYLLGQFNEIPEKTELGCANLVLLEGVLAASSINHDPGRFEFIQDSVVAMLERERGWVSPRRVELPTFRGDGLFDKIDIDNSASLLNRVEIAQ